MGTEERWNLEKHVKTSPRDEEKDDKTRASGEDDYSSSVQQGKPVLTSPRKEEEADKTSVSKGMRTAIL